MRRRLADWKRRYHPQWIGVRRWALDQFWPLAAQASVVTCDSATQVAIVESPAALEPYWGYAVHRRLGVIDASLVGAMQLVRNPSQRHLFAGLPSFSHLLRRKHVVRVPGIPLSLRNRWDSNYYHATIECFGGLAAYADSEVLNENTLVIGKGLARTSIWSEFVRLGGLGTTPYVVQDSAWVIGDGRVAFIDLPRTTGSSTPENGVLTITEVSARGLRRTLALLETVLPERGPAPDLHLYVTRGASDGRRLRNENAIVSLFCARGFDVVDPGSMPWAEQAALFRRAARVAGVHGAALTNVLYRWPETMQLLEITEPGFSAPHYRNIAEALGYEYVAVRGDRGEGDVRRQTFDVDVDAVTRQLDAWEGR